MKINLYDEVELDDGRTVVVVANDVPGFLLCEDESRAEEETEAGEDRDWVVSVPISAVKRVLGRQLIAGDLFVCCWCEPLAQSKMTGPALAGLFVCL